MNRRRVTVSPSKAPGILRSAVYLLLVCRRSSAISGGGTLSPDKSTERRPGALPLGGRQLRQDRPPAPRALAASSASVAPQPTAATPACQTASASSGRPSRVRLRAQRDDVGQLGDRVEVAELRPAARGPARRAGRRPAARGRGRSRRTGAARRSAAGRPRGSPRSRRRRPPRGRASAAPPRRRPRACRPAWARAQGVGEQAALGQQGAVHAPPARSERLPERRGRGVDRALDVLGVVGQRREPRLELRRRRVDAARQQAAAPGARRRVWSQAWAPA